MQREAPATGRAVQAFFALVATLIAEGQVDSDEVAALLLRFA